MLWIEFDREAEILERFFRLFHRQFQRTTSSQRHGVGRTQLDRALIVGQLLFDVFVRPSANHDRFELCLRVVVADFDGAVEFFESALAIPARQRFESHGQQVHRGLFVEFERATQIAERGVSHLSPTRIGLRGSEDRAGDGLSAFEQRSREQLAGELLVLSIQPFVERTLRQANDLRQIFEILDGQLRADGSVEIGLAIVFDISGFTVGLLRFDSGRRFLIGCGRDESWREGKKERSPKEQQTGRHDENPFSQARNDGLREIQGPHYAEVGSLCLHEISRPVQAVLARCVCNGARRGFLTPPTPGRPSVGERRGQRPAPSAGGLQWKALTNSTRPHPPLRGTFSRREKGFQRLNKNDGLLISAHVRSCAPRSREVPNPAESSSTERLSF